MTVHEDITARRTASRSTGGPHISIDLADALNHLARTVNRSIDALWDALEAIARAIDEGSGSSVDS